MLTVTSKEQQTINKLADDLTVNHLIRRRALLLREYINTGSISTHPGSLTKYTRKLISDFQQHRLDVFKLNRVVEPVHTPKVTIKTEKLSSRSLTTYITKHKQ